MPILIVFDEASGAADRAPVDVDVEPEHAEETTTALVSASRKSVPDRTIFTSGPLYADSRGIPFAARRTARRMKAFKPWTVAATVVALALLAVAVSHSVYDITSPVWLSWHVVLRKIYSIVAFALVGVCVRKALVENGIGHLVASCICGVGAYSALIEVLQFFYGSHEGLGWNAFDTSCGALGGALATIDLWLVRLTRGRGR
jgi:hypothetical protein